MCFESNDIEFVWSSLKFTILYGMKLFIPKVRLRSHQRPKWVTSNLQHDLNHFRTLKRKCKLHPTLQNVSRLKSTESMLQEKLKQAKSTYETTLVLDFASSQKVAPLLSDISLTASDVYSELTKLDPSKSMGIDNIGPKVLKYCANALYLPIHHLFCLSLSYQSLPAEWCLHSVTPIFKSGDRTSLKKLPTYFSFVYYFTYSRASHL